MKRVIAVSLMTLMALCIFISCNPSSGVEDNVSVTLTAKNDFADLEKENLTWKYTAIKTDGLNPKDGETEKEKNLNNGKTDSLSQGEWNFTLYGYKADGLVCKGTKENVKITKDIDTVTIDVDLLQNSEGTITVKDDVKIVSADGKTSYSLSDKYSMTVVIADANGNVVTEKKYNNKAVFTTDSQTVASGSYKVTISFIGDDTATYTKSVVVYDYLDTVISGSLNGVVIKADTDKSGTEATTMIDEDAFETKTTEDGKEVVENVKVVEVVAPIAAIEETEESSSASETKETTVTFPAGSLKKTESETTEAVTLSVTAATAAVASASTSDYTVKTDSDDAVIAGFEFKLEGADSSDLSVKQTSEDGKTEETVGVTVTTYIAKGLGTKTNIEVKYLGENTGKAPEIVSYDTESGKLVFTVYHFSKYAIISKNVVAADSNGNMYTSLKDALAGATKGATVTLLKDITGLSSTIDITRSVTLDLNGYSVSSSARTFFVKNGTLTIQNGTIVSAIESNAESSAIRVSNNTAYSGTDEREALGLVIKNDATIIGTRSYGVTAFGMDDTTVDIFGKIYSANAAMSGNGTKTLTGKITVNVYDDAILTAYGAPLTYSNGSVTAGVADSSTYKDACGIYQPNVGGVLNVYGGKVTSKTFSAVEVRNGKAEIKGGTFKSEATAYNADCKNGSGDGPTTTGAAIALNYYGIGVDTTKNGLTVTIEGGTFEGVKQLVLVNPRNLDFSGAEVRALVGGVSLDDTKVVANVEIEGNGYYLTLEDAISDVEDGETVKLLNNIVSILSDTGALDGYDSRLWIANKNVTVDFNGKKLVVKSNYGGSCNTLNIFGSGCTVKNGTIITLTKSKDNYGYAVATDSAGYDAEYPYRSSYALAAEFGDGGTLLIKNMTIGCGVALYGNMNAVFENSTVDAARYYALYQEGYRNSGCKTTIRQSTFTSNDSSPIFWNAEDSTSVAGRIDSIVIESGKFNGRLLGGKGVGEKEGKLTVTGGTFSTDPSDYVDTTSYKVTQDSSDNPTSWTVSAIDG